MLDVVALGVGAHLAVTFFLLLRYLDTRAPAAGLWAAGYGLLAAQDLFEGLLAGGATSAPIMARHALFLAAGLLVFGSFPSNRRYVGLAGVISVVAFASFWPVEAYGLTRPWSTLSASAVEGVLFVASARAYRGADGQGGGLGTLLVTWALALTGLLEFAHPFLRLQQGANLAGAAFSDAITLMLGTGLILRTWHDTRDLEMMNTIAGVLNRTKNVRESLSEALRLIASLLGVESGWVFLRERDQFVLAASHGLPAVLAADSAARMTGECRCLAMLGAGQLPLAVNVVDCQRLETVGLQSRHATVPLRGRASTVGLMNLVLPGGRVFDDRKLQILSAVGNQIGVAVERGLLFDEVVAKERSRGELLEKLLTAHEDERRRIARELHDEAGQSLTALIVNLELAVQEPSSERLRGQLTQLRDLAERTLGEIRRLIYDLRPSILDDLGLAAALRWYAKNLLDPRGITWTLSVSGVSGRLPAKLETVAFRLVQEALTNVLKHAEASSVTVNVAAAGRELHVRIEDNGRGFDPRRSRSGDRPGGFGLLGMQERVELVGGRWEVQSTPGVGTVVTAVLPILDGAPGS
jgi:signal transduction histidine kinase